MCRNSILLSLVVLSLTIFGTGQVPDKGELKINGVALKPVAEGSFLLGDRKAKFITSKDGVPEVMEIANTDGSTTRLLYERDWKPAAANLEEFTGEWSSEEAQSQVTFNVENGNCF